MKKITLLLAAVALTSVSALAQNTPTQKTEVDVRENGTVKAETTTRTGRTKAGQKIENTGQDVKYAGKKTGHAVHRGAQKTGHAVKKGVKKVGNKAEDVVD
ncbi:hypothetical protein F0P96_05420 [Hymenobacter busanensis]|uniref:Uncharacterized protein n=1 Tax=Hymenobacter busanensis TaxID=2607656 RepID=A0A7L5A194_9BACT|nr:hypothetical protein [Hymenobacter busanensis]KAA9338278.1 hypothetical protein F0P96_05420 [Hymenobacter busanensis]QHJ09298.1 hypothetical protein GUY19_19190 [Hymenobacter busanensis]